MALTKEERQKLYAQAKQLRKDIIDVTSWAGGAHIGGGLSVIDILTILYFKYLNIDPERPDWEDRDRLVLSKGHAAVAYVPCLAEDFQQVPESLRDASRFEESVRMRRLDRLPGAWPADGRGDGAWGPGAEERS